MGLGDCRGELFLTGRAVWYNEKRSKWVLRGFISAARITLGSKTRLLVGQI